MRLYLDWLNEHTRTLSHSKAAGAIVKRGLGGAPVAPG